MDKAPLAPGQYLGYSLQPTRLLVRLLDASPGDVLSVECLDDVGHERPDGSVAAEQDKSVTGEGNPVADRAVSLWKTFANWIGLVEQGTLALDKTTFVLYVSQPKSGSGVSSFDEARDESQAQAALSAARKMLWGDAPAYPLRPTVSKTLAPHLNRVFTADPATVAGIVARFSLVQGSGSPQDDLTARFLRLLIPRELVDDARELAQGWVKAAIDRRLERKLPARITFDDFHARLLAFVRKRDCRTMLVCRASAPTAEDVERELLGRTYLDQLALIEADEDEKLRAANDYLRSVAARTRWAERGEVDPTSFDEHQAELQRYWSRHRVLVPLKHQTLPEPKLGTVLYHECCEFQAKLEGLTVDSFFNAGCYHALADDLDVGWHPSYRALLERKTAEAPELERAGETA